MSTSTEVYDPISNQTYTWEPLDFSEQNLTSPLGAQGVDCLAAYGTCGDPLAPGYSSYRKDILEPAMLAADVPLDVMFNPEVPEWDPRRASVESLIFARGRVLTIPVTNQTSGEASIAETGIGAYGAVKRGQKAFVYIANDSETPEFTQRARMLASQVLGEVAVRYPMMVSIFDDAEKMAAAASFAMRAQLRQTRSGVRPEVVYRMPPAAAELEPAIYLSGTSGKKRPAWMDAVGGLIKSLKPDAQVDDSYRENWTDADAVLELNDKKSKAVQLIAVTDETESLGALAEIGPRLLLGDTLDQSVGIYIQDHPAGSKATIRTRTLVNAHLDRLLADFPRLPVFRAKSLADLAFFGISEYNRQQQKQERRASV